jgi:hypothetical protein
VVAANPGPSATETLTFDPVWLILKRARPNLDPPSFVAPGELSLVGHRGTFGPSSSSLVWPTARPSKVGLTMDRILAVRRKRWGWGLFPRFVEITYASVDGTAVAYFNDGAWKGWRPLLTGSNRRMVNAIRQHLDIV